MYLPLVTRKRFGVTRQLIRSAFRPESNSQSILFFTGHKCASSFISGLFDDVAAYSDYQRAYFDEYFSAFEIDDKKMYADSAFINRVFFPRGIIYGPFRDVVDIPQLAKYKILLLLRDPRDVLTSRYFSARFTHSVINRKFYYMRLQAQKQTIDEFVMDNIIFTYNIYCRYMTMSRRYPHICFYKYEDMIVDQPSFLDYIIELTGVSFPEKVQARILNAMKLPEKEDINQHKRSGKAGQYKKRLRPETVQKLNDTFFEINRFFNFV